MSPRPAWTRRVELRAREVLCRFGAAKVVAVSPGWNRREDDLSAVPFATVDLGLGKTACVQKTNTSRKALAELTTLDAAGRRYGSAPLT